MPTYRAIICWPRIVVSILVIASFAEPAAAQIPPEFVAADLIDEVDVVLLALVRLGGKLLPMATFLRRQRCVVAGGKALALVADR